MSQRQYYRWDYPSEWLAEKIDHATPAEVRSIAHSLVLLVGDEDKLQDLFQSEMDADDYFNPLEDDTTS